LNVTPAGSVPTMLSVGWGKPVAVTVKLPGLPTRNVVPFGLVKAGACPWPVPDKEMVCWAGFVLLALSVSTTEPVMVPTLVGVKLILTWQLPPGASEKLAVQSAGVPEPVTWAKLPGVTRV